MTTNQEARHQDLRDSTSTARGMTADWHALWDGASVADGTFNERLIAWINAELGTSYTNLPGAMHAYAADGGFANWHSINAITTSSGPTYAVNSNEPDTVADFAGVLNSGTEYYRVGGSETTFASMFTHARASNATMTDSDGLLKWAPHNVLQRSAALATSPWDVTSTPTATNNYAIAPDGTMTATRIELDASSGSEIKQQFGGAVASMSWTFAVWLKSNTASSQSLRIKNTHAGVLDNFSSITVTTEWQLFELEVTNGSTAGIGQQVAVRNSAGGGVKDVLAWGAHLYRSDLGGMVDNWDRSDSYVPTTSAARYLPRRNNYRYNGSSYVNKGVLLESAAATQLLHTTGTLVTQNVTVTAQPYTLHFSGTGTVTLSGASTAGPLVGTGTGEQNRVRLTFTPSAGTLTLTVSGTVSNAQLEAGSIPTSYIPNLAASGTVTRAAETLTIAGADMAYSSSAMSFHVQGEVTYADTNLNSNVAGNATEFDVVRWFADSNNFIHWQFDTDGTRQWLIAQKSLGVFDGVSSTNIPSPGVAQAFNVATRHTNGSVNVASNGTAGTADNTPTSLPDLSSTAFPLGEKFVGTIALFRQWDVDLGDTGIEAAST